eukprot:876211-Ditylum_brightwellii.AAC.1
MAPKCSGLLKQDYKTIMAFVGTDPDAKINIWSYDQDKEKCLVDSRKLEMRWGHKIGLVWSGQFRPKDM